MGISAQVFAFLDLPEENMEAPGAKVLPRRSRSPSNSTNASFAYDGGPLILKGIDLKVPAGTVVAIVGSSGAGKTTLVNLLPRFYNATAGAVRIDGFDVRDVTLRSLREQMAIVTQETILFNDTIWNNLCYGRPDMPEEKVVAAAQAALAHDFIMEMPQGYQTLIGERGQRLSGGQRQRLAIARAAAEGCANPDPGRSDVRTRLGIGNAGAERAQQFDDRPHGIRDRASPFHHPPRGRDRRSRQRHHSRMRHP